MCWKNGQTDSGFVFFHKSRKGMMLLEMMMTISILSLAAVWILPEISDWYREQRLNMAAAQVSALIRTVQAEARNGDAAFPTGSGISKEIIFSYQSQHQRVRYMCRRTGISISDPKGWLPEGIRISPTSVNIKFAQNGYPYSDDSTTSIEYSFHLRDSSRKGVRKIVVAAYTGRVRIEKES